MTRNPASLPVLVSGAASEIVGDELAVDIHRSLVAALEVGTVFLEGMDPDHIFRAGVAAAVTSIEERSALLRRFLADGPFENPGEPPPELRDKRLTDQQTAKAINFIYAQVVSCFQGRLAELLAAGPCARLIDELKAAGRIAPDCRLYFGDSVTVQEDKGPRRKAADMHVLHFSPGSADSVEVDGIVEVKSYACSWNRLQRQLDGHLSRVRRAGKLHLANSGPPAHPAADLAARPVVIGVIPASWKLPRTFSFHQVDGSRQLMLSEPRTRVDGPRWEPVAPDAWRLILPWSEEALASAAYEMTFWYMEKLGEQIYSGGVPAEWSEMTPGEAGRNAAKMMLYYALLRRLPPRVDQRAVALYNAYGFGYALGMSFRDRDGKRQVLWFADLEEIEASGETKDGWSIRG